MIQVLGFDSGYLEQADAYKPLKNFVESQQELRKVQDAVCEPEEKKWLSSQNPDDLELDSLWGCIIYLAATTSYKDSAQQKLVDFVAQLQKRPTLEKDGQVCEVNGMTVWKDLPTFGWAIRDAWNFDATNSSDKDSANHWININAFVAALLATDPSDHLSLALFGLWVARDAFEESKKVSNAALAAAAVWIVKSGPTLWQYSSEGKTFDGKVAKPGADFRDNEWRGFTQARWGAWQQRLNDASGEVSDPTSVDLVQQALKIMDKCQ